jgi:hypothetical protein
MVLRVIFWHVTGVSRSRRRSLCIELCAPSEDASTERRRIAKKSSPVSAHRLSPQPIGNY